MISRSSTASRWNGIGVTIPARITRPIAILYEPGKSEIKRRFTSEHVYRTAGDYRIQFRLKKLNKALAAATTSVKVRPESATRAVAPT